MDDAQSRRDGRRALLIFVFVEMFYYTDRNILNILMESVRVDLGLTDAHMGALSGLAFAVAYVVFAIPVARLSDRYNRARIVTMAMVIWSAFTALFGLARDYANLVGMRIGVAVGEAGGLIPMQSLIADMFPADRRGGALALLYAGGIIGSMIGFAVAGALHDAIGWRGTFIVVGIAGLVAAPLVLLVREPKRGESDGLSLRADDHIKFSVALEVLRTRRSYVVMTVGFSIAAIAVYANATWLPTFMVRQFGFNATQTGLMSTVTLVAPMLAGVFVGGRYGDKLANRDPRWTMRLPAFGLMSAFPVTLIQVWSESIWVFGVASLIPGFVAGIYVAPLMAGLQALAGARLRGLATALSTGAMTLLGQGLGPIVAGVLSSGLSERMSELGALRSALSVTSMLYVLGAVALLNAGRTYVEDLRAVRAFDELAAR